MEKHSARERSFRTLLKGEAREALIFSGSNFLNKFGGFLLLPVYWRMLSPEDYGVIAIAWMFSIYSALLSSFGTDLSINRFYYEWPEESRKRNLGAIWAWTWVSTCAWAAVFLLGLHLIGPKLFPSFKHFDELGLGVLAGFAGHLLITPTNTMRIKRLSWIFAGFNTLSFLLSSGMAVLYVVILKAGLKGYFMAQLLSNLFLAMMAAALMAFHARPCFSNAALPGILKFSLPVLYANLISSVGSTLDRFMLAYFSTLEVLGLYALALKFAEVIGNVHTSLKMTYTTFLMRTVSLDKEHGADTLARMAPYYVLVYFVAGLGISIFTGDYVRLIGQPAYFPIIEWVPPLVGVIILSVLFPYYAPGTMLFRTDRMWISSAAHLAALAIASAILIRPYQLYGVVATRYIAGAVYLLVGFLISRRIYPIPHRWWKLSAFATLAMAGVLAAKPLDALPLAASIPSKTLLLGAYAAICYIFILRDRHSAPMQGVSTLFDRIAGRAAKPAPAED